MCAHRRRQVMVIAGYSSLPSPSEAKNASHDYNDNNNLDVYLIKLHVSFLLSRLYYFLCLNEQLPRTCPLLSSRNQVGLGFQFPSPGIKVHLCFSWPSPPRPQPPSQVSLAQRFPSTSPPSWTRSGASKYHTLSPGPATSIGPS